MRAASRPKARPFRMAAFDNRPRRSTRQAPPFRIRQRRQRIAGLMLPLIQMQVGDDKGSRSRDDARIPAVSPSPHAVKRIGRWRGRRTA